MASCCNQVENKSIRMVRITNRPPHPLNRLYDGPHPDGKQLNGLINGLEPLPVSRTDLPDFAAAGWPNLGCD